MNFEELVARRDREREAEREQTNPAPVAAVADVEVTAAAESGDAVLNAVETFLSRFTIYPTEHAKLAHVLWIAHTHLMDAWDSTPRLAFLSPEPASGKTRALEVTELLVPSPVEAVNVSPAYLFRKVGQQDSCTILFDEIDTVFGPKAKENEEIRGLLNAGHRRGAVAGRCVVEGKVVRTEEISAYCAVALAGLGWLPDTIMSRAAIIRMRRRKPGEVIEPFRRRMELETGHKLKGRLERWAKHVQPTITWPEMPAGVEDRDADVWEALIAVADAAGGDWPKRAREAAKALVGEAKDREPSLGIRLLADLKTVFGDAEQMTTEAILRALHNMTEAPWNDLKGKPLNERGLAQRLRQYNIKPKVIRVGEATPRGYTREGGLHDAWQSYLPPSSAETSATSATSATNGENPSHFNAENVAYEDEASATNPNASATDAADVADRVADVADDVADRHKKNGSNNNSVADVVDVALVPEAVGDNCNSMCAHCGRPGAELWDWDGGRKVLLHPRCADAWADAQRNQRFVTESSARTQPAGIGHSPGPPLAPDDLTIPTFLQRGHADCVLGSSLRSEEDRK
jgi:hypothetical protein